MRIEQRTLMMVTPSLRGGGAEKVAATLACALARADAQLKVHLVLLGSEAVDVSLPNIDVLQLGLRETGGMLSSAVKFFRLVLRLAGIVRRVRPSTVVSFMDYLNVACILATRIASFRVRVVLTVHTLLVSHMQTYAEGLKIKVLKWLAALSYGRADAVIAVSRSVRDDLVEIFRVDPSRVHVVHNPIDVTKIQALADGDLDVKVFQEGVPVILAAGRLSAEKGFDRLLQAYALLSKDLRVRLIILGEGSEETRLRPLSRELGLGDSVSFPGYQENPYAYMRRAAVFVVPSQYEGFGLVIIEAMACGVPVVATRSHPGIGDIIEDNGSGLLVDVGDVEGLAKAMARLIIDADERLRLAGNALRKVSVFSVDEIVRQYRDILHV